MEEQPSPLHRLMQTEGFKPFSGPDAIRVYRKAITRLNMENMDENDLLNAVSSLGVLLETEIALMYALQDQICTRCGKCCTQNKSMRVQKNELKQIAEHQKTSYKKIKRSTRALPRRDGTMKIKRSPCPFYDDECTVYPVRPGECRGYPANVLLKSIGGKAEYPTECEISDELLVEIAIKRALEEKMQRENPELMKELAEKKRKDLGRLGNMTQSQRLAYLVNRYQKTLNQGQ
ncbi:MAG: YkgJ family cysteine cluster protein [Candidatus Bathyarchaeota archaeon]|nr:YkgJ family cysteine cluster protein [Candidatus Bathyarchaeota archaeon]